MSDVRDYCDETYKRLVGLKAGLYDVITKAGTVEDSVHSEAVAHLNSLVEGVEAGLEELTHQCPSDWSPNRKKLDDNMTRLSEALSKMADDVGVDVPDTTAWL